MVDWTVAMDDLITQRWQHCFVCGVGQGQMEMGIQQVGVLSITTMVCLSCRRRDPRRVQLQALLQQRYGNGQGS